MFEDNVLDFVSWIVSSRAQGGLSRCLANQQKKLADFLQRTDRFLDVRDFLERAIDVFLAWEQNPGTSIEVMAKMNPTMAQYQVLSLMMQPEALAGMYGGIDWPKEWGSKWIEFQKNNPLPTNPDTDEAQKQMSKRKSKEDFKIIQENMTESKDFLNNIKFKICMIYII